MNKRIVVNLHAIHGFPMSNLNRDRNGMPKLAVIDGELRRYLSSMSFRRAFRTYLTDSGSDEGTVLSRHFINDVARELAGGEAPTQEQLDLACQVFCKTSHGNAAGLKEQRKNLKSVGDAIKDRIAGGQSLAEAMSDAKGALEEKKLKKAKADKAKAQAKAEASNDEAELAKANEIDPLEEAESEVAALDGDAEDGSTVSFGAVLDDRITFSEDGSSFTTGYYTSAAFLYPPSAVKEFAAVVTAEFKTEKERGAEANSIVAGRSTNIAAFGRMFANSMKDSTTGAMQVAPSFSVAATSVGSDFYVAHDDRSVNSGAAMMGNIEYDAPVVYRYANIDVGTLEENLRDNADQQRVSDIVARLVEAFTFALPTGAQSRFAAHTLPSVLLVTVGDRAVNYSNAFRDPIEGPAIVEQAAAKLVRSEKHARRVIGDEVETFAIDIDDLGFELGNLGSMPELLSEIRASIEELTA